MPQLIQDAQGGEGAFGNMYTALTNPFGYHKTNAAKFQMTGVLKAFAGLSRIAPAIQNPLVERAMYGVLGAMDTYNRAGMKPVDKLYDVFPGYMSVYAGGRLDNIIPLQFEAKITSDSRETSYETTDFGVNELATYNKTSLRRLTLETMYATLDPGYFNTHYVEGKVREIQSLVYAGAGVPSPIWQKPGKIDLASPPLVGLFIGDKFLRRRLPRVVFDNGSIDSKLTIDDLLDKPPSKTLYQIPGLRTAIETTLLVMFVEPIYWRVDSVEVDWDEAPYDVDFSQGNIGSYPIPGQSKLPMFQKVRMSLIEHRSPSTIERRRDVDSFTTTQNTIQRALG